MSIELQMLVWSIVLGIVYILIAATASAMQRGAGWAAGSRDEVVPALSGVAGRLERAQRRLRVLANDLRLEGRPAIVAFEGWDAAGKGGVIRRLVEKVDPRNYIAHSIGAPAGDDKVRHYLWRFWRRLPEAGRAAEAQLPAGRRRLRAGAGRRGMAIRVACRTHPERHRVVLGRAQAQDGQGGSGRHLQ